MNHSSNQLKRAFRFPVFHGSLLLAALCSGIVRCLLRKRQNSYHKQRDPTAFADPHQRPLKSSKPATQGGPPLFTDDPATPDNGHWEINLGFTLDRNPATTLLEAPRLDVNYGLGDHIQLKYEIPWLVLDRSRERTRSGLGNSLFGVKWRFADEERRGISVSMYPQLEFNNPTSSSADRGLVERGAQFLLPVEMARRVGPVDLNWEFGYRFKQHTSDEWLYGLAFGRQVHKRLELLGEIHGTARRGFGEDELVFDLGGRLRLDHRLVLLFTTGRSIRGLPGEASNLFAYLGIQFNF